jgi:Methyltransferase FkbM domain
MSECPEAAQTERGPPQENDMARQRSSAIGPALVGLAIVFATWWITRGYYSGPNHEADLYYVEASQELEPLRARYGPERNSENFEEWIIRDFFQNRRDGVFLDVGAHHYKITSNTYYLATGLGWSGVAIEAQAEFGADYATFRPRTRFVAMFASDVPGQSVEFFVPKENPLVASASREFTEHRGFPGKPTSVPTTTLNVVLEQAGISKLDFMTMDIELSEPMALAGFDIDRYMPALVCIEAHPEVRQQILDYFTAHHYVVVGKYLRADPKNLYFRRFMS